MRYPETAALIKQARLKKGLSQEKAARRIGCSRLQWINWEQGLHRPEKYVAALVGVIGVNAKKLEAADDGGLDQEALLTPLTVAIRDLVRYEVKSAQREMVA